MNTLIFTNRQQKIKLKISRVLDSDFKIKIYSSITVIEDFNIKETSFCESEKLTELNALIYYITNEYNCELNLPITLQENLVINNYIPSIEEKDYIQSFIDNLLISTDFNITLDKVINKNIRYEKEDMRQEVLEQFFKSTQNKDLLFFAKLSNDEAYLFKTLEKCLFKRLSLKRNKQRGKEIPTEVEVSIE